VALARRPGALPGLDPSRARLSPSPVLAEAAAGGERTVVLPLLHGPLGEDGTVQGLLELAGVPYVGSRRARLGGLDGQGDGQAGARGGRHPPGPHRAFADHERTPGLPAELADELGLPCFVKPANMGSSVGVSKASTVEELRDAIEHALTYDEWVVVEEAVTGREIEVAVLGNTDPEASVPGEIVPGAEFYSYEDKYVTDGAQLLVPAPLAPDAAERGAGPRPRVFGPCAATAWPGSTSSTRSTAAASCATRSTRCPASRRSRCTPSSGCSRA
jgi:D-alanine-D-alanine ligase